MAPFRKNRRPKPEVKPYLAASKLAWSTVHVPTEAQAGGAGVTESQFFDDLDFQGDDFMGLQEVEDVDVVYEDGTDGSRLIRFQPVETKDKAKAKVKETGEKRKRPQKDEPEEEASEDEQVSEEEEGDFDLDPVDDEELEVGEASDGDDAQVAEEEAEEDSPFAEEPEDADDFDDDDLAVAFSHAGKLGFDMDDQEDDDEEFDDSLLPAWASLPLHPSLKRALHNMKFTKPTEIQAKSLPPALGLASTDQDEENEDSDNESEEEAPAGGKRDVVGVSQTGSGKTLAYGLPILQWLFENGPGSNRMPEEHDVDPDGLPRPLGALILCPTRELAMQVSTHLSDVIKASCRSSPDSDVSKLKLLRRPHVAVICGGMSELKQKRMLEARGGADMIVATPGRLWEMARLDDHLAARIKRTRFLVLDEADRMVEVGHFKEMENILNLVNRAVVDAPEEEEEEAPESTGVKPSEEMQTFVFSATLSKALQVNLKRKKKVKTFKKKKGKTAEGSTLDDLMDRVDFRDDEPVIVDLTPGQGMPAGLLESKIECLHTDKDLYLYYFLLRYPGRSLVFLNSIDGIRRLVPILSNLKVPVYPIHSQLQQKQRLKALERFKASTSGVLLATDVAARGLDIPSVDHVVHYQLPRSADTYVHRSGRTARAGGSGVSLSLIEPKEKSLFVQLNRALRRDASISSMPIEYSFLTPLKPRMVLARQIDMAEHKTSKAAHEEAWIRDLAKEADMDFDADETAKRKGDKVRMLKRELEELLATPLSRKGLSHRYITSGRTNLADQMLDTNHHETILGLSKSSAQNDLRAAAAQQPSKKKLKKAAPQPAPKAVPQKASKPTTPKSKEVSQAQKLKAKKAAQQILKAKRSKA